MKTTSQSIEDLQAEILIQNQMIEGARKSASRLMIINSELLEACKAARELVKLARRYFPKSVRNSDTFHLLNVDANTIAKAISKAEGQS